MADPGATNDGTPSTGSTRGALSRNHLSMRALHRSGASSTWESAEIIRKAAIASPPENFDTTAYLLAADHSPNAMGVAFLIVVRSGKSRNANRRGGYVRNFTDPRLRPSLRQRAGRRRLPTRAPPRRYRTRLVPGGPPLRCGHAEQRRPPVYSPSRRNYLRGWRMAMADFH